MPNNTTEHKNKFHQHIIFIASFTGRAILIVIFYGLFTPISWIMRLLGNDPLQRKRNVTTHTYYCESKKRPSSHMNNSF